MQATMNLKIKFRESFRPFAPAVLREDVDEYFDVYVTGLPSMADAAAVARDLGDEGWETDLVVFSKRS